jgi:hypothetical protein
MCCNEAWDGEYSKRSHTVSAELANGPGGRSSPGTGKYDLKCDYADINAQSFLKRCAASMQRINQGIGVYSFFVFPHLFRIFVTFFRFN